MSGQGLRKVLLYESVFAVLLFAALSLLRYAFDDSYIHFRISENLLLHGKPYYNIDEPVMSTSSTGWTVTLFVIFLLAGVKIKAVSVFNAVVTTLCVYVYASVLEGLAGNRALKYHVLSSLVIVPVLLYSSIGLMETPLALLVLGIGILLYLRGSALSFLFIAMCVFFRLELVVFLFAAIVFNLYSRAVPARKMFLYAVLGALPFVVFDYAYFGTVIPQTARAKMTVYVLDRLTVIRMMVPKIPLAWVPVQAKEGFLVGVLLLSVYTSARAWARVADAKEKGFLLLLVPGMLVMLAYVYEKVPVFLWYTPLFTLPLFVALAGFALNRKSLVLGVSVFALFLPFVLPFGQTIYAAATDKSAYPYFQSEARVQKYLEVAKKLYERCPTCTLMSSEIGGLGFGFKGKVYDAVGLISEDALKYHPLKVPEERRSGSVGAIPVGYVKEVRPDIIVSYDVFCEALMKSDVMDDYVLLKEDVYAPEDKALANGKNFRWNKNLNILIRKDKYVGLPCGPT